MNYWKVTYVAVALLNRGALTAYTKYFETEGAARIFYHRMQKHSRTFSILEPEPTTVFDVIREAQ